MSAHTPVTTPRPRTAPANLALTGTETGFTNAELHAIEHEYSAPNYHPLPAVLATGKGVWVWDVEGKKYLDMLAGYSALSFGHQHPRIMHAFMEQARRLCIVSRAFENDQLGMFCKELAEFTGFDQVLPMNTGAEAVETAVKTARKWGYIRKSIAKDQAEIIVCSGNFHGRTTTVVSFSSTQQYKENFGPLTPGFKIIPFGDADALAKAITPNTCAFLVEPVQGEGGINVPPEGYLKKCRDICTKNNVLLVLDEVQTGFARTGKMFGWQWENAKPDLMCLGKALGGGVFPVSAVVSTKDIFSVFKSGDHGSTFGGNPLGAAVAREAMRVMKDENLAERAHTMGEWLRGKLRAIKTNKIKEVRGKGLLNGIELNKNAGEAKQFVLALVKEGVLCKDTAGQVIRITPPLVISEEEMQWGVDRIAKILA